MLVSVLLLLHDVKNYRELRELNLSEKVTCSGKLKDFVPTLPQVLFFYIVLQFRLFYNLEHSKDDVEE